MADDNYCGDIRFCVLMGSPRLGGNTAELCKPFITRLRERGAQVEYLELASMNVKPCMGCYACQNVAGEYGCVQHDDMYTVAASIIAAHCVVYATPIYTWFCTAQMKSVLDRHYGFNKFYGSATGSLWKGKHAAIIATHGYDAEYGAGPFAQGVERMCKHSGLVYDGIYSVRDENNITSFRTTEAISGAREFADRLMLGMSR